MLLRHDLMQRADRALGDLTRAMWNARDTGGAMELLNSSPSSPSSPAPSPDAPQQAVTSEPESAPSSPAPSPQTERSPQARELPQFRVLLHNDDHTPMDHVVRSIVTLTPLPRSRAHIVMLMAHTRGVALLLITHRERAELYQQQFRSKGLTVSIEPME